MRNFRLRPLSSILHKWAKYQTFLSVYFNDVMYEIQERVLECFLFCLHPTVVWRFQLQQCVTFLIFNTLRRQRLMVVPAWEAFSTILVFQLHFILHSSTLTFCPCIKLEHDLFCVCVRNLEKTLKQPECFLVCLNWRRAEYVSGINKTDLRSITVKPHDCKPTHWKSW